jgi:mono/diheme cytochrome c family protein
MPRQYRSGSALVVVLAVGLVTAFTLAAATAAAPSPKEVRERIDAVAKLLAAGKPDEAAAALAAGIEGLEAMRAGPQPTAGFKLLADRAAAARKALEKAGIDVTMLEIPAVAPPAAAGGRPAAGRPAAAAGVSFTRQVAPMLVRSCGGCHVTGRRGNFQMASYDALMRSGMVQRGVGNASRLVEVILSGDMPRGGGRVSPDEVGMLVSWINAGAVCDADPMAGLDVVARGAAAAPPAPAPVMPAAKPAPLKPGDVAFSSEIVPLLLEQCGKCHGERDPENNFQMASLETLVKGGRSGPAVIPGKGADSLLVKKLKGVGIDGQRMPLGRNPLPDAQVALIEKWIDQGARIDLLSPRDSLDKVAAVGRSQRLSDAQLSKLRFAAAEKLWERMIPDEQPTVKIRDGVCVVGNLPPARLDGLATEAADVAGRVARELGADGGGLLKGGVAIYAFRNAFDYSSLWQVVMNGERPRGLSGHAGTSGDVVYGALIVPAADETGDDTRLLLAEQIAAAALAGRGLPAWFCAGAGRAVATKLAPKAVLAQEWKREAGAAVGRLGSAQDFFAGHADPAATSLAAGGFVSSLAAAGKLAQLVALVDGGASFDEAFAKVFRGPPQQAFTAWAARSAGR